MESRSDYVLGHSRQELERLEKQGQFLGRLTRDLLVRAGVGAGMRVLDYGAGAGDVTLLAAELVGPEGQVVALDASAEALSRLRARAAARGLGNIITVEGDESHAATLARPHGFDAVVGRLVLLHQRDPEGALGRVLDVLRPGGVVAFHEIEIEAGMWSAPTFPLMEAAFRWIIGAFTHGGMPVDIGRRIARVFARRGLVDRKLVREGLLESGPESLGPEFMANTVRALLPVIVRLGLATAEEVEIDSLAGRMREAIVAGDLSFVPCYLVGASARAPM